MKATLEEFLTLFSPEEAVACDVRATCEAMAADEGLTKELDTLRAAMPTVGTVDYRASLERIRAHAARIGQHPYTVQLVAMMLLAVDARARYRAEGLSDALWADTMRDILYKCTECRLVHGITGTFVPEWFEWFFTLRRFTFGRLQFECIKGREDYTLADTVVRADEWRINIHIPRTGTPMSPEAVDRALSQAAAFFGERQGLSRIIFEIHSWLLYPAHETMLGDRSNIKHFMHRFTTVASGDYADYSQLWRLFDKNYEGDPDALPADSSMRRAYIARVKRGEPIGWGYGIFVYHA